MAAHKFTIECEACFAEASFDDSNVIRNVKVLGNHSRNKRHYPPSVIEAAKHLYESVPVYLNHKFNDKNQPVTQRGLEEELGEIKNPHMRNGELYGDFHLEEEHPFAARFKKYARSKPKALGFSHVADLDKKTVNGEMHVTKIKEVLSVDAVKKPATTNGLFESEIEEENPTVTPEQIAEMQTQLKTATEAVTKLTADFATEREARIKAEAESAKQRAEAEAAKLEADLKTKFEGLSVDATVVATCVSLGREAGTKMAESIINAVKTAVESVKKSTPTVGRGYVGEQAGSASKGNNLKKPATAEDWAKVFGFKVPQVA